MIRFMRHAYCERIYLDFRELRLTSAPKFPDDDVDTFRIEVDRLFVELIGLQIAVDSLSINCCTEEITELLIRGVQCFKSVNTVEIDAQDFGEGHPEAFTEDFFVSLADRGVRTLDVMMPGIDLDLGPALAFGFAEPERGGRRELTGVRCASGSDLLTQVQKKASELSGDNSFDFDFSIMNLVGNIDSIGLEKYQTGDGKWLINDLGNRVFLAIEKAEETVKIKVRSSP
ncbi:hypothetical protein AAVH_11215 [Aphelenchoides avenae]|nr:hypothetical protein AAVH_11215 [Aphelenchus avenae]